MKKVTSKTITPEQIENINKLMGYQEGSRNLPDCGYAFYYNQICIHNLDVCDADRYANLNTILGYDIGLAKFRLLDNWLWQHQFDLIELSGSDEDKEMLKKATKETKIKKLDYSSWRNMGKEKYMYSYFENSAR